MPFLLVPSYNTGRQFDDSLALIMALKKAMMKHKFHLQQVSLVQN